MATTADRIRQIIADNLDVGRDPDFDAKLVDSGVSSVDCIAFFKIVNDEFSLGLVAEECRQFETLNQLVQHIDQKAA
ncbi:MAG: phosphopantetheine-binding protein [bacterium]|uniref:SupB n=1 Tax=Aplysina aerophoba bacterial symbiont clone pAPKS18 TaxID=377637 RepID=A4U8Q9_9BACT|nr:SupB [Aplysina aerophoba bacterial symbiont clone pAPKS18]MCY4607719.1 phosphopantetheine-binding protein [bacterium]